MLFLRKPKYRLYWLTTDLAISREPRPGDFVEIEAASIKAIVDLREQTGEVLPASSYQYIHLPVEEGASPGAAELALLVDWIVERIRNRQGPVLIHCREGRGRSALVACATVVALGFPLAEAYHMLRRVRKDAALGSSQLEALRAFAQARSG